MRVGRAWNGFVFVLLVLGTLTLGITVAFLVFEIWFWFQGSPS